MGYLEAYDLALDAAFLKRLTIAITETAIAVNGEASTTAHTAERTAMAFQVLHDPHTWARKTAQCVCADTAITAASADAVLSSRYSALWTKLAKRYNA